MEHTHDLGPLPRAPEIQEFEVGIIRMPADNSLLGIAHFRVYVRNLNPDGAIMHARIALPEAIREQCYFNVKPWPHQDADEQVKRSLGVETLAERIMAPAPTFKNGDSDTTDLVAVLERFKGRCAEEAAPSLAFQVGPRSHAIAESIQRIDVRDWLLQDSFTVGITKDALTLEGDAAQFERELFAGLGVPREYIEAPVLPPAFTLTVDQTGICIRVSVNDKPIGIIQRLELLSEVNDSDTVPRMWGKITFFSYPGMPEQIKQDRQQLRDLPWMLVEELEFKNE